MLGRMPFPAIAIADTGPAFRPIAMRACSRANAAASLDAHACEQVERPVEFRSTDGRLVHSLIMPAAPL
jgi:hypothetical protein